MSTFRGRELAYRAFVRTPRGAAPMLIVAASCYYAGTRSKISLEPSDGGWRVVESEPFIAAAPVMWSVAAAAVALSDPAPTVVDITASTVQQVAVEPWQDVWPGRTGAAGIEYKALARPHDTSGRSVVFVFAACVSPDAEVFFEWTGIGEWTLRERPANEATGPRIAAATTAIAADSRHIDTVRISDAYGICPVAVEPWLRGRAAFTARPQREPLLRAR